jgi:hypothetical protein
MSWLAGGPSRLSNASNYVNKAGDTMTGTLTTKSIVLSSQGNNYTYALTFDGGVGNRPSLNYQYVTKVVYFADAANANANFSISDNGNVSARGSVSGLSGSFNGPIAATSAQLTAALFLNGAASASSVQFAPGGTLRYFFGWDGTNFTCNRYNASGTYLSTPWVVRDTDGVVSMGARPIWAGLTPWDSGNRSNPPNCSTSNAVTLDWGQNYGGQVGLKIDSSLLGYIIHSGNVANQLAYSALHLRVSGNDTTWSYAGQGGSPTYVWGTNDGINMAVWGCNALSVNYANVSGSANALGGDISGNYLTVSNVRCTNTTGNMAGRGGASYLGWNDTGGTGEGVLTCNNAGSTGGWTIRTVNSNNSVEVGRFTISASGTGTNGSDKRLKKGILPIKNSLDKICQLEGVSFTYRKSGERSYGLIAQDVQPVFPDAVVPIGGGEGEEDFLGIQYAALTAPLIEAIKELKGQLDAALQRINVLEGGNLT